jgi:hypothetical protein
MKLIKGPILDARGVEISPDDVAIYGFGVSRSVAMAEGRIEPDPDNPLQVSLTPTGLVRVRVVRRSYSSGEKPVVAVIPDRLVVLKSQPSFDDGLSVVYVLPWSPLMTQDHELYETTVSRLENVLEDIERLSSGGGMDDFERRSGSYPDDYTYCGPQDADRIAYWLRRYRQWEQERRKTLEGVCQRLGKEMPL